MPEHEVDLLEGPGRPRPMPGCTRHALGAACRGGTGGSSPVEEAVAAERRAHLPHHARRGRRCRPRRPPCSRAGSGAGRTATICVAGQRLDRLDGAGDRAAQRASRPQACAAKRLCTTSSGSSSCIAISSRITSRSASTSSAREQRAGDHVAEHVDGQRQVLVEDPGVEAGVLLGGEGVELTADRVERDRDVQRRALARCP